MSLLLAVRFPYRKRAGKLFPPRSLEGQRALEMLRHSPLHYGLDRTRWSIDLIRRCIFENIKSYSGAHHRMRRLGMGLRQGRVHICSPDPQYDHKVDLIKQALCKARSDPDKFRLFYADEVTFYQIGAPSLGWAEHNSRPKTVWRAPTNNRYRILAGLDAVTGQVIASYAKSFTAPVAAQWLVKLREEVGPEIRIIVVWDNWSVHYHQEIVDRTEALNIELLYTPTYAPWTNPIEKLWRWLRQDITHMSSSQNRDEWVQFRQRVQAFIDRFAMPSPSLIQYVGLGVTD